VKYPLTPQKGRGRKTQALFTLECSAKFVSRREGGEKVGIPPPSGIQCLFQRGGGKKESNDPSKEETTLEEIL